MVTWLSCAVNTSAKPSSDRYAAAANDDGRLAIPIHPNEPSCQAISIHVSIISANDGSTPPTATGLNADISPVAHISSTIAPVSVRIRSDSEASARTRSRIPRAGATTRSSTSAVDVIAVLLSPITMPQHWPEQGLDHRTPEPTSPNHITRGSQRAGPHRDRGRRCSRRRRRWPVR
jgi:hypothetical protein